MRVSSGLSAWSYLHLVPTFWIFWLLGSPFLVAILGLRFIFLALSSLFWICGEWGFCPFSACAVPSSAPFLIFAMSRSLKRTIVLDVSGFPDDCPINSIASKICDEFSDGDILSVQFMPSRTVRVTFKDESVKLAVLNKEFLSVDSIQCPVRGGGPRPENVLVYRYPFEADLSALKDVMSYYGVVHNIQHRSWLHLNNVADGSIVVRMTRSQNVPRTINVNNYLCKAWYKGMPLTCDICEGSHKAQDCPYKGRCMRCRQPGHVQRDCTNQPNAWGTASADPTPAEVDAVPVIDPDSPAVVDAAPVIDPDSPAVVDAAPVIDSDSPAASSVPAASPAPASTEPCPPASAASPASASAVPSPAPIVPYSDSSDQIIDVTDAGSCSQSVLPKESSSEVLIESFTSTASGSESMQWSDLGSDVINAIDSQIAPLDTVLNNDEVNITVVNSSGDNETYDGSSDDDANECVVNETNKSTDNVNNDSETNIYYETYKSNKVSKSSGVKNLNSKKVNRSNSVNKSGGSKSKTGRVSPYPLPNYKSRGQVSSHVSPHFTKGALAAVMKPSSCRK